MQDIETLESMKENMNNLCNVVESLVTIIKNLEGRISRLEGRLICSNCNADINLSDEQNNELYIKNHTKYHCKFCNKTIDLKYNDGKIEVSTGE